MSAAAAPDNQEEPGAAAGPRGKTPGLPMLRAIRNYLDERVATGGISRVTMLHTRGVLYDFADHAPGDASKITRAVIVGWLGTLSRVSPNTRRLYFVRARGFTTWLLRRGVIRRDPFLEVPVPKVPRSVHRCLDGGQARALLSACRTPRETLIVILGLHTGLRRAELAALDISDINLGGRTILVASGKGGHQRLLPLSTEAVMVVRRYLDSTGLSSGPLLRSEARPELGIRPGTVSRVFSELAFRSGVKLRAWDRVGPHSLRHTFATDTYEATGDVLAVRDLLGHVNLENTQRYVRGMSVERLRGAVERSYLGAVDDEVVDG